MVDHAEDSPPMGLVPVISAAAQSMIPPEVQAQLAETAVEAERVRRLREVWKLVVAGRHSPGAVAAMYGVSEDQVRRDAAQLRTAARYDLYQDAAANHNLLSDVISIVAASRQRMHKLQTQLDTFEVNQRQIVEQLEFFALQEQNDPLQANVRAMLILDREQRLVHNDFQVEEKHLLDVYERTGLLRALKEGEIARSAEASIDMRMLQQIAGIVSQVVSEASIDNDVKRQIVQQIGAKIDNLVTDLRNEILEMQTVEAAAQAAVA